MTDVEKAARAALPNTKPGDEWMDSEMTNHVRALVAENERLRQRWVEQLRSENTRLHDLNVSLNKSEHDAHMLRRAEVGEARAENERLREALKTISSGVDAAKRIAAREMRQRAIDWFLPSAAHVERSRAIDELPVEGE